MRCRYARRTGVKSERWKVTLYFGGKKWVRYSYDDRVPLSSEFLAQRLCHAINAEIERLGAGFSPKAWFKPSTHELRMENYARDWLERRSREIAPATYVSFKSILEKYVIPILGHLDIRSIRKGNLDDYLLKLPEDFSPKTKEIHISLIRTVLISAFKREDLQRVPPFPSVKVQAPEIRWLDCEQQEAVFGAIPEEHQAIFRVLGFYGMRPGEERALMWDCIDWSNKTITVYHLRYLIIPEARKILRVETNDQTIEEELHPFFNLMVLVYLTGAKEIKPEGKWVSEKDLKGGLSFFQGPHGLKVKELETLYGNDPEGFLKAGQRFGGKEIPYGNKAFALDVFPRIPLAYLLLEGNEEFPPKIKVLYDATIQSHLPLDIIWCMVAETSRRLAE